MEQTRARQPGPPPKVPSEPLLSVRDGGYISLDYGRLSIEASLPKRRHFHNTKLLALGDWEQAVKRFWLAARPTLARVAPELVEATKWSQLEVARLDITFDLPECPAILPLLRGFQRLPRVHGAHEAHLYESARRLEQRCGPKQGWEWIWYEKDLEWLSDKDRVVGKPRPNTLRGEFRPRTKFFESALAAEAGARIKTVRDVTPDAVRRLHRAMFDHLGLGTPLVGVDALWVRIDQADFIPERSKLGVFTFAATSAAPYGYEPRTPRIRSEYVRWIKEIGMASSDVASDAYMRLDYNTASVEFGRV